VNEEQSDSGEREPVDPIDLLRAMLAISPEDAAAAREDAAEAMKPDEQRNS
jgi:hypothetical protein